MIPLVLSPTGKRGISKMPTQATFALETWASEKGIKKKNKKTQQQQKNYPRASIKKTL